MRPPLLADSQGNMQALANGDWFLGWGQVPDFSEFSPEGALLFDAHFPAHDQSYRGFRFSLDRHARPPSDVRLPARRPRRAGTVYASWNGATQVAAWRVLAGPSAHEPAAVAQAPRGGFETAGRCRRERPGRIWPWRRSTPRGAARCLRALTRRSRVTPRVALRAAGDGRRRITLHLGDITGDALAEAIVNARQLRA